MGVGELGVQVQIEVRVQGELLITHLQVSVSTLLDDRASVHRLQDSIDRVEQVLKKDRLTSLNGHLNSLDELGVGESSDLHVTVLLLLSQPSDTLQLGIDNEGVPLRCRQNRTVLDRHFIRRQVLVVPVGDLGRVGQHQKRVSFGVHGDFVLLEERHELLIHDLHSELLVEGSNIGHEGRGEQYISDNLSQSVLQFSNGIGPTSAFRTKSCNQTVGHVELRSTLSGFGLSSILVIHNFLELVLQDLKSSVQLSDFSFHFSFLGVSFFKVDSCLFSCSLFGGHVGEHIVVDSNVSNPITKTTSAVRLLSDEVRSEGLIVEDRLDLLEVNGRNLLSINIVLVVLQLV